MKLNKWTLGLAAAGVISIPLAAQAEEKMNQVWTSLTSTTISGYVDTSAHWNLGTGAADPGNSFGGPAKQDGFNLNVVQLSIERPLDESQWAAGYKVDLLFGPDANTIGGLGTSSAGANSDFGIRQAYVALRAPVGNGLDFKVGVFDTIIGYEVFDSGGNPNYTRSYGYAIEPTTHTGVLASYQISEMVSVAAGIANTTGPAINSRSTQAESYKAYMASIAFTAPENMGALAGSTLYAGFVNGDAPATGGPDSSQTSLYAGASIATPVEGLAVGASYDYLAAGGAASGYANATALYLSFQATEKLTLHTRGEYFTQSGDILPGGIAAPLALTPAVPGKVLALTATAQYDLWQNVISRLELRWDHQADGTGRAYGDGDKRNAYLVAANLIYQF